MLTISGITAIAEKAHYFYNDVDYVVKAKQRESSIFRYRDQCYESMKRFLQEGHFAFRDDVLLTDADDVAWLPIERPIGLEQVQAPRPTFFDDSIHNVARYTFVPGRFSGHLFVSALACVAQHRCLLQRIVPLRFEQNCSDMYEAPREDDADDGDDLCSDDGGGGGGGGGDSGNGHFEEDGQQFEGEEDGQISSYENCTNGEMVEETKPPLQQGPKSFGLFRSSYRERDPSAKLGIWDSDSPHSSNENLQQQQTLNQNQVEESQNYYYESVPATPSPQPPDSPVPTESNEDAVSSIGAPIMPINKYAGLFRFRLWNAGTWVEVVVDEMLPYDSAAVSSSDQQCPLSIGAADVMGQPVRDMWLPLLEKAYAKLLGRYECLATSSGGCIEDFLTDLSGGMCETIHLRTSQHRSDFGLQASLGQRMHHEMYSGRRKKMSGGRVPGLFSLLCAMDEPHNPRQEGQIGEFGLVFGRAYPITDVREISFTEVEAFAPNNHTLLMVRLRDPFGPAGWNGPFSRGSPEWLAMSPVERFKIGLVCETESDFWMPIDTFCSRFTQVTFCRIVNKRIVCVRRHYWDNVVEGSWRAAVRMAGGSFDNNRETFLRNPQYMFRVEPHHSHVMISLSQQFIRQDPSQERHSIGFTILHVEENRIYRVHHIPTPESGFSPIVVTTQYRHTGPVYVRLLLYHGRYVIIPTTNEAQKNGNFLLRLISPHQCYLRYLNQDIPAQHLLMPYPMCVTRVRVIRASSLQRLDRPTGPINAYCMIWCERHWVRTKTLWHNTDPEWNQSALFYRRWSATLCVKVVIWHQAPKLWRDQYLGKHIFQAYEETGRPITVSLYGRRRWENNQPRSGVLTVEITSSADVGAL